MKTQILIINVNNKPPGAWLSKNQTIAFDRAFALEFEDAKAAELACVQFQKRHGPQTSFIPVTNAEINGKN